MTKKTIVGLLALATALQGLVLVGMVVKSHWPIWFGQTIQLKALPVDPRSLFRGNYAILNYDISQLQAHQLPFTNKLRQGDKVYVSLKPTDSGVYTFAQASIIKPEGGIFIRGHIQNAHAPYRIVYGIEAFFAPKEKALALERQLQAGALVTIKLLPSGRAALLDVSAE